MNGRSGYNTWWKCEYYALMGSSIEGGCCLEPLQICKRKLPSTLCLNVCRLDPHFVLWYSRRESFVSYLISTQCWSLANQNKSFLSLQTLWLSFFVKDFIFLIKSCSFSEMFFVIALFQKSMQLIWRGRLLLKSNILSSKSPEVPFHMFSRTF